MSFKKLSFLRTIKNLILVVPSLFAFTVSIAKLMKYEAGLVGKKLFIVLIGAIFLITLLGSTWMCLMIMLFVFLASLNFSALGALSIILLLNIILLVTVAMIMLKAKKHLFFPETSRQIRKMSRAMRGG